MRAVMRLLRGLLATGLILACIGVWTAAAAKPARTVIEHLDAQLIATMKQGEQLGFSGRYRKIAPVIDASFDLSRIARLALGSQWDRLNAQQQQQYRMMFRQDTIATYASRFDRFNGQSFRIKAVKDAPGSRRQVNTVLVANGEKIPVNYVLENEDGDWKIVNVVAKGVSNLALKRGQYTSAIQDKGVDGFIKQFRAQLDKYPPIPDVPANTNA